MEKFLRKTPPPSHFQGVFVPKAKNHLRWFAATESYRCRVPSVERAYRGPMGSANPAFLRVAGSCLSAAMARPVSTDYCCSLAMGNSHLWDRSIPSQQDPFAVAAAISTVTILRPARSTVLAPGSVIAAPAPLAIQGSP